MKARQFLFVLLLLTAFTGTRSPQSWSEPSRLPTLAEAAAPSRLEFSLVSAAQPLLSQVSQPSQPLPAAQTIAGSWSASNPPQIYTVSIHNAPVVDDKGSHCILCGLATGNLTAVEPNLGICVQPNGVAGAKQSCTGVCMPGHDCKNDFPEPARARQCQHWSDNDDQSPPQP